MHAWLPGGREGWELRADIYIRSVGLLASGIVRVCNTVYLKNYFGVLQVSIRATWRTLCTRESEKVQTQFWDIFVLFNQTAGSIDWSLVIQFSVPMITSQFQVSTSPTSRFVLYVCRSGYFVFSCVCVCVGINSYEIPFTHTLQACESACIFQTHVFRTNLCTSLRKN